jgi:hypothetical protein
MICVESGLLHECSPSCPLAVDSADGTCPISGVVYSELRDYADPPREALNSNYTLARSASARLNPEFRMGRGDAVDQWTRARYAVVSGRVEARIRQLVFSEKRRAHALALIDSERRRLAAALVNYMQKGRRADQFVIDATVVAQMSTASKVRLERLGVSLATDGPRWADAIRSIAERCTAKWMLLEMQYGTMDIYGADSHTDEVDIEQLVAGDATPKRARTVAERASVRCLTLTITDAPTCKRTSLSFRVHVATSLLTYSTDFPDFARIVPSEKYIRSVIG